MEFIEHRIPEWGWLCTVSAGGKGFIRNRAEEKRYRDMLFRKAKKEMVCITDYICREGKIYVIISADDSSCVRRIINSANAGYGKYKKLILENVCFDPQTPVPLIKIQDYSAVKQQIFNTFYVAENL